MTLMNVQCHRELCDTVNVDTLYLVKLIFGKYFYFEANRVTDFLQLHSQLVAIRVPVHESVKYKIEPSCYCKPT